ncbi:hypothetical protein [Lutibacter sp. B1]|uniref:hypothetical protein n=1 Tax=Lutibacter sp. B1 TaxID=2725996 RepID=UPI0014566CE7|nr:hypothetical protein [Lutibacter sp. B1]NLP57010.1 hypothetical protein [Lutibacter sp. B1]
MKTLQNQFTSPEKYYTVKKTDTNNNNILLPNILYTQMEYFATNVILSNTSIAYPIPQLYKLQLLKNVYTDDTLAFKAQIKKYNELELQLLVDVFQKKDSEDNSVCKAIFRFNLKEDIPKAS